MSFGGADFNLFTLFGCELGDAEIKKKLLFAEQLFR